MSDRDCIRHAPALASTSVSIPPDFPKKASKPFSLNQEDMTFWVPEDRPDAMLNVMEDVDEPKANIERSRSFYAVNIT